MEHEEISLHRVKSHNYQWNFNAGNELIFYSKDFKQTFNISKDSCNYGCLRGYTAQNRRNYSSTLKMKKGIFTLLEAGRSKLTFELQLIQFRNIFEYYREWAKIKCVKRHHVISACETQTSSSVCPWEAISCRGLPERAINCRVRVIRKNIITKDTMILFVPF